MTKKEHEKYHKEVKDKYGNIIRPGDLVIFPDSYHRDVHTGIVDHFGEELVIVHYGVKIWMDYSRQISPRRLIKIKDKEGNYTSLPENRK